MKIRTGFVSNSSSSSFIVSLDNIDKLLEVPYQKDYAIECATETAEDSKKWFNDYPEYRSDDKKEQKEFSESDYKESFDKVIENHIMNYDILRNIKEDGEIMSSLELSYNFRYKEDDVYNPDNKEYKDLDFSSRFDTYEIVNLSKHGIDKLFPMSYYYSMKKFIDNPKNRLELYRGLTSRDVRLYPIYMYECNRRLTKNDIYKIDKREVALYKKKYEKMNSKEFYDKVLLEPIVNNIVGSGWNSWVNDDNDKLPKELVKFISKIKKSLIPICDKLVDDFIIDNKNTDFIEVEYSDGGGCGIDAIILERGVYFDKVEHIRVSHH